MIAFIIGITIGIILILAYNIYKMRKDIESFEELLEKNVKDYNALSYDLQACEDKCSNNEYGVASIMEYLEDKNNGSN